MVPYSTPQIRPQLLSKTAVPLLDSDEVKESLFARLGIEYQREDGTLQVPILPKKKQYHLESIRDIPWFKFDPKDYPLTEKEVYDAPAVIESNAPCVTQDTPMCHSAEELKGINVTLWFTTFKMMNVKLRKIYSCRYFDLTYAPPYHIAGRLCKSRPAILTLSNQLPLNDPGKLNLSAVPALGRKKLHPLSKATNRSLLRQLYKAAFLDKFWADQELPKKWDGLYRFSTKVYPDTEQALEEFQWHMGLALRALKTVDEAQLRKEAKITNSKVDWKRLTVACKKLGLDPIRP